MDVPVVDGIVRVRVLRVVAGDAALIAGNTAGAMFDLEVLDVGLRLVPPVLVVLRCNTTDCSI